MKRIAAVCFLLAAIVPAGTAAAKKPPKCGQGTCPTLKCARDRTLCLIAAGENERALELLKEEKESFKGRKEFHLLLARAYLSLGNTYWALATLSEFLVDHPGDCEVLSWVAWVNISLGDFQEARNLLEAGGCAQLEGAPIASRFPMLMTFAGIQKALKKGGSPAADPSLKPEKKIKKIFPEDMALYRYNRSVLHPGFAMPLVVKAEAGGGYTTNALMGAPSDPAFAEDMDSALIFLDLWSRFLPPLSQWINPSLEVMAKGTYFFNRNSASGDSPERYSTLSLAWRPGLVLFKERFPRILLAYRGDLMLINQPTPYEKDTPTLFFEGHRAELEIELPHLAFFGGAGRRFFDEAARTRWELDGGFGGGLTLGNRLSLLGAVTVHSFMAGSRGYDAFGAVGLLAAAVDVWKGLQLKALLSLGMDNYKDSEGYFEEGKIRKDTSIKVQAQVLSPAWKGLRVALVYEFSDKMSTIEAYAYMDHRVTLKLMWHYGFDLFAPRKSAGSLHVPLDYGLGDGGGEKVAEKIQDLLRQDESITRGSSCKE